MLKEFKDFLMKGNLLEIAVGLILAIAFKDVVDALVAGILTPIIAAVFRQPDFARLVLDIGEGRISYGLFLNAVFSFVVIGFVLFTVVKAYNQMVEMSQREGTTDETEEETAEVILLQEIRAQLSARR